ncbi:MAG: DUF6173 family protein [Paracoccaceae bacterium]
MDKAIKTTAEAAEADAIPRLYEVHTDPKMKSAGKQALRKKVADETVQNKSPAEWAYERIIVYLKNFEEQLDSEHEVAMGFAGGDTGVLRIEGMGYFDPDVITFYGSEANGAKTQLIQHVSQLNVMLRALPKQVDQPEVNRIGFRLAADLEKKVKTAKRMRKKKS